MSRPTSSMSGVRKHLLARRRQRRRRRLAAEEVRHLRLHPGARVERRAVVGARDERRRRAAQVALLLEERLEPLAHLGRRAHGGHSRSGRSSGPADRGVASDRAARRSDAGRTTAPQTPLPHREGLLVLLVVLAAAGAGVWFGRRMRRPRGQHRLRRAAPGEAEAAARRRRSRTGTPPRSRRRRLLYGTPLLAGAQSVSARRPRSSSTRTPAASSGRERPHERRKIASLTKIMTATLALREVPWQSTDHRRPLGHARAARARGTAHRRARQGLEALLRAAPLLRERRREPARDLERRLGARVPPRDERRGAGARAARHALHEPERDPRPRQLLDAVGPRGADPVRVPEPALRPARADEGDPRALGGADELARSTSTTTSSCTCTPARTASRRATRTSRAGASSRPPRSTAGG